MLRNIVNQNSTKGMHTSNCGADLIERKASSGPIHGHTKPPHLIINLCNFPANSQQ